MYHPYSPRTFLLILAAHGLPGLWIHVTNIVFDVVWGIDTTSRCFVRVDDIQRNYYATTSARSIDESINVALRLLSKGDFLATLSRDNLTCALTSSAINISPPPPVGHYLFCDIGAGKGKPILLAIKAFSKQLPRSNNFSLSVLAIEFDRDLANILSENLRRVYRAKLASALRRPESINPPWLDTFRLWTEDKSNIIADIDIANLDVFSGSCLNLLDTYQKRTCKQIFYMCDPLDLAGMVKILSLIYQGSRPLLTPLIVIYSNPLHVEALLRELAFLVLVSDGRSSNPQSSYVILTMSY